ncbi:MAG: hypothetical protein FJY83_09975, partial [Candidatus Aminicenantes bacterium]|nr:hypothetical protein [Candidatus Aminicenantes bacterium]
MAARKFKKILAVAGLILADVFLVHTLVLSWKDVSLGTGGVAFRALFKGVLQAHAADIDGNGIEDITGVFSDEPYPRKYILKCFSPFLPMGHQPVGYFFEDLALVNQTVLHPIDLEGGASLEIPIVEIVDGSEMVLRTRNSKGEETGVRRFSLGQWNGYTSFDAFLDDLDADGGPELVATFKDFWNQRLLGCHGIVAYDVRSGRRLWEYALGTQPLTKRVADVDGDGRKEIVVCGWGAHNGMSANGTDDDHSYIIVLDSGGRELWKKELGYYYTMISFDIGDVDGDGHLEIVTGKSCHRAFDPDAAELKILDAATGREERALSREGYSYTSVSLVRTKDGGRMVAAGDSKGGLTLFDGNLRPVRQVRYESPIKVIGAAVLGEEGAARDYLFVRVGERVLEVLTPALKRIHREELDVAGREFDAGIVPVRNGREHALALTADTLYLVREQNGGFLRLLASVFVSRFAALLLVLIVLNGLAFGRGIGGSARRVEGGGAGGMTGVVQEIAHRM